MVIVAAAVVEEVFLFTATPLAVTGRNDTPKL